MKPAPLTVCAPAALPQRPPGQRWLVEDIWPRAGVGIIGGAPKTFKTWMALDLAISVATATPCLGTFACPEQGRTLIYAAEDSLPDLRQRLLSIATARGCDFNTLDLGVITVDKLHLDRLDHLESLNLTLATHKPALLVLDPFVRLHRSADENSAADVSRILGALRALQRRHQTAIVLVHHARKNAGGRLGQALRGSSDFYAWGDVNIHLTTTKQGIKVGIEHRSAASPDPFHVHLIGDETPSLQLNATKHSPEPQDNSLPTRLLNILTAQQTPTSQNRLRTLVRARNQDVAHALKGLLADGHVQRKAKGWLASHPT